MLLKQYLTEKINNNRCITDGEQINNVEDMKTLYQCTLYQKTRGRCFCKNQLDEKVSAFIQ